MKKVFGASIITLATLFLFVGILFAMLFLAIAPNNLWIMLLAIPLTIMVNGAMLLLSPLISDLIYSWYYRVKWISPVELQAQLPELAAFITKVTTEKKFQFPRIGIIDDLNPQAFTYGSHRGNGRIIFTKGILNFLNTEEINAVIGHELGHIYNLDFIVMTIASTMLQIMYIIYEISIRVRSRGSKKGNPLALVGLVAYIFYFIGTYILLLLSRLREYMADNFSAVQTGNPESLASALVKVAYGILSVPDTGKSKNLLESTRALGLVDVKSSKGVVNYLASSSTTPEAQKSLDLTKIFPFMVFDLKSPWAFLSELNSTHPLTAKRIKNLAAAGSDQSYLNKLEDYVAQVKVDNFKLYGNFFVDLAIKYLPLFALVLSLPFIFIFHISFFLALIPFGMMQIVIIYYTYPAWGKKFSNLSEAMQDLYVSPFRGTLIADEATIIGKADAGNPLTADLQIQDEHAIVSVGVKTMFGFISNIFFALTKYKKLLGQKGNVEGHFFRSMGPYVILSKFQNNEHKVNSYPRLAAIIGAIFLMGLGVVLAVVI
ncbi:MAG: M48 family metalloprotease [bacterium]